MRVLGTFGTPPFQRKARAPSSGHFMLGPGQQSSPARFTSALSRSGEFVVAPAHGDGARWTDAGRSVLERQRGL